MNNYEKALDALAKAGWRISNLGAVAIAKMAATNLQIEDARESVAKELQKTPEHIRNAVNHEIAHFYMTHTHFPEWLRPIRYKDHLTAKELVYRIRLNIICNERSYYYLYDKEEPPFFGGWTEIRAKNVPQAKAAFTVFHPEKRTALNIIDSDNFSDSKIERCGHHGKFCNEVITIGRYDCSERTTA